MEVTVCSQDGNVNLYFVLQAGLTETTCSNSLICAFQACQENSLNPEWLMTEDCLKLSPAKQDVFVCDPFEGEAFDYFTSGFKSVVLGPRCILSSLHRKESIPELPSPIHNTAMKGLVITLTGFEKEAKVEIQMLVERMAGIYSNNFHEGVTHLVAKSVGSKKYFVAVQHDIPVMTGEWVKAVWTTVNQDFREDILATDQQFLSYACPVFKGLVICVSQMQRKEKEALKKIIEDNGGTYSAALEMSVTSVLIIPSPEGDKYTHACNWRIQCLTPDWIYDSVEQGSALNMEGFRVKKRGTSTPTDERSVSVLPDISLCSTIMNETGLPKVSHINETVQMDMSVFVKKDSVSDDRVNSGLEAVENLDMPQAMKAGLFLDGCKIFLYGFSSTHMEKLRRVLNAGGATRFNQLNESVSHVVLGKNMEENLNIISNWTSKPHIIYADWIVESIRLKRPADEAPFAHLDAETCVSAHKVKKTARTSVAILPDKNETYVDEEILNQYVKSKKTDEEGKIKVTDTANMSSLPDSQASLMPGVFSGKLFTVSGYDEDTTDDLIQAIQDHGGEIVPLSYHGQVHYSLLNVDGTGTAHPKAAELISYYFIDDCIDQEQLVLVDYFHLPLQLREGFDSLADCTVAVSAYQGKERAFLVNMATALGAKFQEMFAKKPKITKDVKASTHLICAAPEGNKYHAAIKWGVPAVTRDWLLDCARSGKRASEEAFTVDQENSQQLDGKAIIRNLLEISADVSDNKYHVEETAIGDVTEIGATPMYKKVRTLREESSFSPSKIKTPDAETFRKLYPTPGVSRGNDSLSEMATPDTPYGSTWYPNPSSRIKKGFKRLIDAIPEPAAAVKRRPPTGTPIAVYYKRFFDDVKETVHNYKPKDPVWLRKDGNDKKTLITEDENNRTVAADNHGPLTGVVICTGHKLLDQQRNLYQTVADLGGDYRWAYDHTVTHFVFQGRSNDTNKEFRLAREQGKIIVSPEWVWMCHNENTKIDEVLFPHTHNPKMSLSLVSVKSTSITRKGRLKKKNLFNASDNKEELGNEEKEQEVKQIHENGSDSSENMEEEQKKIALSKQLEEIEALATVTGSGRRSSSLSRNRSVGDRLRHTPTQPLQVETPTVTLDVAESQNTAITWDDPQEREARLKLQNQLTKDTQEIISHNQQLSLEETETEKENTPVEPETTIVEKPTPPRKTTNQSPSTESPYVIMLLGMMEDEKSRYTRIVEELGGTVSTAQNFDFLTTHVITAKPSRSERHLAAIASGKWMLFDSFLDESLKAGFFVKEEPYEWGNPAATCLPTLTPGSLELKLATAARRWRITMIEATDENGVKGAFQNMQVLIHTSRDRLGAFTRLIEAGGGVVVKARPPYKEVEGITHFFVEMHKVPEKIDLANFAAHQIPCLPPVFLNDYLIKDPLPNEMDHCIPEYKEILANMRGDQNILKRARKK